MSREHWLAFNKIPGIGGSTARTLLNRFGSIEAFWDAADAELTRLPRIKPDTVAQLRAVSWDAIGEELRALAQEGLAVLTWEDAEYPANLRTVSDAPPLLFLRGDLRAEDAYAVAIVGSRQATPEAEQLAQGLARELARCGVTIVSGLALGIDTAAHRGALEAGRTLAVLGSGLRAIHPARNRPLAEAIARRGALLSEFAPDTRVQPAVLWARNRTIWGLSRAVIVVEAGENSGSLGTARHAHAQGRLVLAVPGSAGTEALIAEGVAPLDPGDLDLTALVKRIHEEDPSTARVAPASLVNLQLAFDGLEEIDARRLREGSHAPRILGPNGFAPDRAVGRQAGSDAGEFTGTWDIAEMRWRDEMDRNADAWAHLRIQEDGLGSFQFGLLSAGIDGKVVRGRGKTRFEFTWAGRDEEDMASGSGWVRFRGRSRNALEGELRFHLGDEVTFMARRSRYRFVGSTP